MRRHGVVRLIVAIGVTSMLAATVSGAPGFGNFVGEVIARWLDDNRQMELIADFTYVDPSGKRWNAPKGVVVDGASIPRVIWTVIGGPFEGSYRNASVVHDVACVTKGGRWQAVHRMFYYAMRAGGVSEVKAAVMYAAVYRFGPRWREPKRFWGSIGDGLGRVFGISRPDADAVPPPPELGVIPAVATEADVKTLETLVEQNNPTTPEEVERLLSK